MKSLSFALLLVLTGTGGAEQLTRIHHRNAAVQQAQAAYARQDFAVAATQYRAAVEKYGATEEAILLNLAHACWRTNQPGSARAYYGRLIASPTLPIRSVALQQLGLLATQRGEYTQAVSLLRQALLASPTNTDARYNYELLRDYLSRRQQSPDIPPPVAPPPRPKSKPTETEKNKQTQAGTDHSGQLDDPTQPDDPRNAPQPRPDQRGQRSAQQPSAAAGTGARGSFRAGNGPARDVASGSEPGAVRGLDPTSTAAAVNSGRSQQPGTDPATDEAQLQTQRARLEQMNLNPDRARQLLNALRDAEQQYLQQVPHKSAKKPDSTKPAW